jgi:hypothetical protein
VSHIRVSHSSNISIIKCLHLSEERWSGLMFWVESNFISDFSYFIGSSTSKPDLSINHLFSGFPCHPTYRFTFSNLLSFFSDHFNLERSLRNILNSSRIWFLDVLSSSNLSENNRHSSKLSMEINTSPFLISRSFTSLYHCSVWKHMNTLFNNHVRENFKIRMILFIS